MTEYPKRPPYFAHRLVRQLFKTCAAMDIGETAALLVVFVAHTEDAKRYTAPPTFFNSQLLPILGLRKWDTLDRARRAAVKNGWLHYEEPPAGTRKPGVYWATIPERFADIDDTPVDETPYPPNGDGHPEAYPPNGYGRGDGRGDGRGYGRGDGMGEHPTLDLDPIPGPIPKKNTRATETDGFNDWYAIYPRKEARKKAAEAFRRAVKRIAKANGGDTSAAVAKLNAAARAFAQSDIAKGDRQFIPHPATWLNSERYEDDPENWKRQDGIGKKTRPAGPGQRHKTEDYGRIGSF